MGRNEGCERLGHLLNEARLGHSGVLVLRGEAGIGKSALLDYATETAKDFQVVRVSGIQSEMELPFASLQQLCGRFMGNVETLPSPQAAALQMAFGEKEGTSPDVFLVGLGALSLLSAAAEQQPLLCVVDDAQWMDQASAKSLAFVSRRLDADRILLLLGLREGFVTPGLDSLPTFIVRPLGDTDSRALLESQIHGRLDARVRDRIIAEARGNPLALLEFPAAFTSEALAGGFGLSRPLTDELEDMFLQRIVVLPTETQKLLQVAAADSTGDVGLLQRALALLGSSLEDARPAEVEGLMSIGSRVTFRHPLVRSAVYGAVTAADRQTIHQALADSTDPATDPDRRAWHRAHGSLGPDEDVAAELELSAARAQARGGLAAGAAFLEKATALTRDLPRRSSRALDAARAKIAAGAPDIALELLDIASEGPLNEVDQAAVERMRAQIAGFMTRGAAGATMLLEAADRINPLDPGMARETYLEAFQVSAFAGRLGIGHREVAKRAQTALPAPDPARGVDLLLDAYVAEAVDGYGRAVPAMRRAVDAYLEETDVRWMWLAGIVAGDLWDDESWFLLADRQVQLCRDFGALAVLPYALSSLAGFYVIAGDIVAANAQYQQADAISDATGAPPTPWGDLWMTSWRGEEDHALEVIETSRQFAEAGGEGALLTFSEYAEALLCNALGRYEAAAIAAERAFRTEQIAFGKWICPELIEASARSGRGDLARQGFEWISERTQASGTEWGLGLAARCRALLAEGQEAEDAYEEAIQRLGRTRMKTDVARAHLLYGEWLRRDRRRAEAREHLGIAHEMFSSMEALGFADRAARELEATGATARKRSPEAQPQLTPQEARIAQLASEGMTNPQIATEFFISVRTVEYHLHKVFTKLGIESRGRLAKALVETGSGVIST